MNQVLPAALSRSFQTLCAPIQTDLEKVEKILDQTLENARPGVAVLTEHLEHYRGKRLRPTLLLLTAHACGEVNPAHHVLGAVVEMIHTATLVHDDVLDSADTRRHVPTVNAVWGNQTSILLGDYLFTHAFHLTSTLGDAQACRIIGEATNRVCEGELHQVCRRGQLDLSEEEYFDIIDGKTAVLTACCCRLGALYAGESTEVIDCLTRFGRYLGMAFQIADDVLDLVGQEKTAGKSLGTDLEQQKLTLPIISLLDHAATEQLGELRKILINGHANKRQVLQPYLVASGALRYAQGRAEEFAHLARTELACLPPSDSRDILATLTEKVIHRDR
jgi:octaprenyl-diphosphate synthase